MMLHKSDTEILEMLFECWQNAASVVLNVYLIALMWYALQKGLLEVLYEIFRLPVPIVTQDFTEALLSVGE